MVAKGTGRMPGTRKGDGVCKLQLVCERSPGLGGGDIATGWEPQDCLLLAGGDICQYVPAMTYLSGPL